jgi:hypothetical protein
MIVECSRRPDGWIPVYGNEEEICEFLLKQNYYEEYSIDNNGDYFDFEVNNNNIFDGEYFNNHEGFFVKLNDDESITVSEGRPSFKDYVVMEFNKTDDFDWVSWLFDSPNVKSLHKNLITNSIEILCLPSTIFEIQEGSILVFDKNSKTLHNVLNRTSVTIDDVLLGNGYAVHGNSINQEIYTLQKRLQKPMSLEERMSIISRIRSLKNSKNREG